MYSNYLTKKFDLSWTNFNYMFQNGNVIQCCSIYSFCWRLLRHELLLACDVYKKECCDKLVKLDDGDDDGQCLCKLVFNS